MRFQRLFRPLALALPVAVAASMAFAPHAAFAQTAYPVNPIRVIVPFPPAGGTDVVARLVSNKMAALAGWNLVIENRAGAGGNIGLDAVAKATPDGYTLGVGQTANLSINPYLYAKMPYDALKDFAPVALLAEQPVVLVVRAESAYKTVADLVAAGKAKPDTLTMASAGNGTVGHLTGELFKRKAGLKFVHVPYKGAGPAATDLLGGQVDFYFATPQIALPFIKSGKLRGLAVSSRARVSVLPDVPTMVEAGYKDFVTTDWKAIVAPKGTPAAVIQRLNVEAEKAVSNVDTLSALLAEGSSPMHGDAVAAASFIKAENDRWGALIRDAGVKLE